jgi:uncharacterized protein (TIGR03382 family)
MVIRRFSLTLAALAGIGLAIAGGADAQSIVQAFTIPTAAVPINDTFTFNLFNTNLGTLQQVNLALSTSITAEVDVLNFTDSNQAFTNATATIPVTLAAPDAITEVAIATAGPISGTAVIGSNAFTGLASNANTSQIVPMADWSFYEGVGPMTNTLNASSTSGTYGGSANPGVFFGGSATAGGTITLTYLYQPAGTIPEPGATTFLAAGVLGSLGMVLRRRRK